jgi:hypothetical protein
MTTTCVMSLNGMSAPRTRAIHSEVQSQMADGRCNLRVHDVLRDTCRAIN